MGVALTVTSDPCRGVENTLYLILQTEKVQCQKNDSIRIEAPSTHAGIKHKTRICITN